MASENLVELETYLQAERHENRKMWDPARRQVGGILDILENTSFLETFYA